MPIKWTKCKFNNQIMVRTTPTQVNSLVTRNWNSWSFKPIKISKPRYACHISRTSTRIWLVDLTTHRRESTRYRCWTTHSCQAFWERDSSMSWIPTIMATSIRESFSQVSFAYIALLLTRRRSSSLRSMILTQMVS